MKTPKELKQLYAEGENISAIMRKDRNLKKNTSEIIEISYDLQSGSYMKSMSNKNYANNREQHAKHIADIILSLCKPSSILEAGIGEATVFSGVMKQFGENVLKYGFDISWSRLAYAQKWLDRHEISNVKLCTGNLNDIPFCDNSIDVVYTSHSIEPNRGSEEAILKELFRVTNKYLILVEPDYELANSESKQRMDFHGYCKNLHEISTSLGYTVLEHKPFPVNSNLSNPISVTIISKLSSTPSSSIFACPKFKTPLQEIDSALFSPEALVVYPIVGGIPCLRIENGIFASKFKDIMEEK